MKESITGEKIVSTSPIQVDKQGDNVSMSSSSSSDSGSSSSVFVYDRHQMNVLEVNKTEYETCNSDNPIHNWTTGVGRDVVPLNVTRHYYFISGKGCHGGMKVAIYVENPPPPPSSAPVKSDSSRYTFRRHIVIPPLFSSLLPYGTRSSGFGREDSINNGMPIKSK